MFSIEDNNRNLTWWWNQLSLSEDWNSMPVEMRQDLIKKLRQCILDLCDLNITNNEVLELIGLTDPPTVWDAILALGKLPERTKRNHWELLAYLKACVISMWQEQHPTKPVVWQKKPSEDKRDNPVEIRKSKLADATTIARNDPNNFKRRYCACGKKLRSDNVTGVCTRCQKNGNYKSEH